MVPRCSNTRTIIEMIQTVIVFRRSAMTIVANTGPIVGLPLAHSHNAGPMTANITAEFDVAIAPCCSANTRINPPNRNPCRASADRANRCSRSAWANSLTVSMSGSLSTMR